MFQTRKGDGLTSGWMDKVVTKCSPFGEHKKVALQKTFLYLIELYRRSSNEGQNSKNNTI
jgi:hypothetical protein